MQDAEHWIAAIEEAIRTRTKSPMMQGKEKYAIVMLMHKAGRHDLASMAHHVIPIDASNARRFTVLELLREAQQRKSSEQ